jgi:hypothetical protein
MKVTSIAAACALLLSGVAPASAAIVITHAKAAQGGITAGDTPGYPVTISSPGSFVLGSNLAVPANKIGIDVRNFDVTIDGAGYRIHGNFRADVGIQSGFNATTVKNVSVIAFQDGGIVSTAGDWLVVDNVRALLNGGPGVQALNQAHIRNSSFSGNDGQGVVCDDFCLVENNVIAGNGASGVLIRSGNVRENTIHSNAGFGINTSVNAGASENVFTDNNGGGAQVGPVVVLFGSNMCRPTASCR